MSGLSRRERREKFIAAMADPEALNNICDAVADGSTLSKIAKDLEANYGWVYAWLHDVSAPDRAEALAVAENARDSQAKEDVIGQLHSLANLDIRDAFDDNGDMLPVKDIPEHVAKGIASIDVSMDKAGEITKKLRFVDRGQMLALAGRRQKMFVDKVELLGQMSLEQAVSASMNPPQSVPREE